ncbi:MAG TPA: amidohydrolase family protein [Clostridia bacterium]|nr:amidohydrolase family protein [Clostridia bacterium]
MNIYERLLEEFDRLEIIDTHEHLSPFEPSWDINDVPKRDKILFGDENGQQIFGKDTNFINNIVLGGYLNDTVYASGIPSDVHNCDDLEDKWRAFLPVWNQVKYSGYGQVVSIVARDLYGIDEITPENIAELNDRYIASLKKGYYRKYLKELAKIKVSLIDSDLMYDPEYFRTLFRLDCFIMPVFQHHFATIERFTGMKIRHFTDWLDACEATLDKALDMGVVGLKCGLAYKRTLYFPRVNYHEAENSFNEMYASRYIPCWEPQRIGTNRAFENFMMHYVCKIAEHRNLVMQVHTGLMTNTGNHISNGNPENMSNLFMEYPDLRFDLFHIGYPYQQALGALALMHRNVYIDMCWAHMISPVASIKALSEWLEIVPHNKILAFGGDLGGGGVQSVYAHAKLARRNVAKALARKVEEGLFGLDEAIRIAKQLFYDNPAKLFGLDDLK